MSTRATYEIIERGELKEYNCFYIHHDGYLAGGANYFKLAKDLHKWKGHYTFAEKFFRANEGAHFTHNHRNHSDTEFRYSLEIIEDIGPKEYKLIVEAKTSHKTWKKVFDGSLDDFIKLHYKGE
jgi:hypothetical protein